jgi:hypothetical protein
VTEVVALLLVSINVIFLGHIQAWKLPSHIFCNSYIHAVYITFQPKKNK